MRKSRRKRVLDRINDACEQFELLLQQGNKTDIAKWVKLVGEQDQPELFTELLRLEFHYSDESDIAIADYFRNHPEFSNEIVKVFAENRLDDFGEHARDDAESNHTVSEGDYVDRFRIISRLGTGGFSTVFLAHDPEIDQAVALKLVRTEDVVSKRDIECIINEANVLNQIDHDAIPKVYDYGEDEFGYPWVSMEFVKGESLFELLATDQLSLPEVLKILAKTARAIHDVHQAGFAHRDLKPDNIIVGLDGEPRIVDYGLALHEDLLSDKSGERAGTTAYMSPEQVRGLTEILDGRTDIWSLGVILYLYIAKRLPFTGDSKEEIRKNILGQPLKPPRQIKHNVATVELEEICFRALKKNPEDRFFNCWRLCECPGACD